MNDEEARSVVRFFEENGFRVLVVGGLAMGAVGVGRTDDGDLMLTVRGFETLRGRRWRRPAGTLAQIRIGPRTAAGILRTPEGTVPFDLLDPGFYSGERAGDEFFDYVARYRSQKGSIGRVVDPAVVWYMRLMIPRPQYMDRILRDRDAGAPVVDWLRDVRGTARRFGTLASIDRRISELVELARVLGKPIGTIRSSAGGKA